MDPPASALRNGLAERAIIFGRSAQIGEPAQAPGPRGRLLFHHRVIPRKWPIIRLLPDRGFKSRPRNQTQLRLNCPARLLFRVAEIINRFGPDSRRHSELV
jgi:hypothetical protein